MELIWTRDLSRNYYSVPMSRPELSEALSQMMYGQISRVSRGSLRRSPIYKHLQPAYDCVTSRIHIHVICDPDLQMSSLQVVCHSSTI